MSDSQFPKKLRRKVLAVVSASRRSFKETASSTFSDTPHPQHFHQILPQTQLFAHSSRKLTTLSKHQAQHCKSCHERIACLFSFFVLNRESNGLPSSTFFGSFKLSQAHFVRWSLCHIHHAAHCGRWTDLRAISPKADRDLPSTADIKFAPASALRRSFFGNCELSDVPQTTCGLVSTLRRSFFGNCDSDILHPHTFKNHTTNATFNNNNNNKF